MFQLALLLLLAGPCIAAPSADKKEIGKVETERDAGMMDIETEVEKRQYYGGSYFNSYGTFSGNSYGGDNGNSYVNSYIYGNSDGSEYGDSYGNNVSGDYDNSYGNSDGSDYGDSYGNNFSGNYDNSYGNSDGSDYGDSYGNNFSGDYDNSYGNSDASDYGDSYGNNYSHNNDYSSSYYSPDYDNSYSNNYGSSYSPQNYDYSSSYNSPDYDNSYSNNYGTTYSNQNNESSSSYYSPYYGNYGNYGNNSSNNIPLRLYPRSYEEKYIMNPATGIGYSNGSNYLPYTVKKWRIVAPTSCHQVSAELPLHLPLSCTESNSGMLCYLVPWCVGFIWPYNKKKSDVVIQVDEPSMAMLHGCTRCTVTNAILQYLLCAILGQTK